jgi:L-cysteate sulfo-lyase
LSEQKQLKDTSSSPIENLLSNHEQLSDSRLPTPCHKLELSGVSARTDLYVKRDDLTGIAMGGNKTRKLDFVFPKLIKDGVDAIVAIGGAQSNFCRVLCAYGARYGISIDLVLGGTEPKKPYKGNLLLDDLFGVNAHFIDTDDFEVLEKASNDYTKKLQDQGKKVFTMPLGGSYGLSTLGYIQAFLEIMGFFERDENKPLDYIFHASGSGGTQAGLILGKLIHGWQGDIIGFSVAYLKDEFFQKILDLCLDANSLFNLGLSEDQIKSAIIIDDNYLGEDYAVPTEAGSKAQALFAKESGLILDSTYTAKAASGLMDYLDSNKINLDAKVLFVHTGGAVGLFA